MILAISPRQKGAPPVSQQVEGKSGLLTWMMGFKLENMHFFLAGKSYTTKARTAWTPARKRERRLQQVAPRNQPTQVIVGLEEDIPVPPERSEGGRGGRFPRTTSSERSEQAGGQQAGRARTRHGTTRNPTQKPTLAQY